MSDAFTLPPLPWPDTALEPSMSAKTLSFHYGKHHKTYVDNLNKLVAGTPMASKSLEEVVKEAAKDPAKKGVFNNAAQTWNHTFFWNSLAPTSGEPTGKLKELIDAAFGSAAAFREKFAAAAVAQFGSGWGWLVYDGGKLAIETTANADTPMAHGKTCLLTLDVWEHAYYLDYQNRRADFLKTLLEKHINWDFAAKNLG
ncbi:MAG: superoxide dismutase [Rhodospirillaceae bacterium]|nr:superoxide dismutase [Rhodospirillaceae bacterium]